MVGTAREGVAAVLFDYAVIIIIIISFFVVFSLDKEVFCLHVTDGKMLSENMCCGGILRRHTRIETWQHSYPCYLMKMKKKRKILFVAVIVALFQLINRQTRK